MEFRRKRYNHTYLNIAPLVDVVFLLLLFFMLTSHLVEETAVKIKLPESKTASASSHQVPTVYVTESGDVYFQDQKVEMKKLSEKIKDFVLNTSLKDVRIKADRDVRISLLIKVIDEIKLAGVKQFSIVTVQADRDSEHNSKKGVQKN